MKTNYSKGRAESMSETDANGNAWNILTHKTSRGIECYAIQGQDKGGSFSYMMFGGKRLNALAVTDGIATEKRIRETHERGLLAFMETMIGEQESKPAPYVIKVGQVIFTDGPFSSRKRAVYKIERPGTYKCVMLDGSGFENDDHVKPYSEKFGIGAYYNEGETITEAEVLTLVEQATQAEGERWRKEHEAREQSKADRLRDIEIGKKVLPSLPAGAKAIICASLREDASDMQSDYHSWDTVDLVYLAFSPHDRDVFSEMRLAAKKFEGTASLATAPAEWEHMEKYSMGHGFYLGESKYHGWVIKKTNIGPDTLENMQVAIARGKYFAQSSDDVPCELATRTGVICEINAVKGGVELYFP